MDEPAGRREKNQWRKKKGRDIKSIKFHQSRRDIFCSWGPQSLSEAVIVRLVCASESPGKFVKAQGRAREFALLASSQVVLMLLVWGPHFQNH